MKCATCEHCVNTAHDITGPEGFSQIAVEFNHCLLHEITVEEHDHCDDHTPKEKQ